ncbi:MAG: MFS transporter [Candidatus Omnitrophota bacterium]
MKFQKGSIRKSLRFSILDGLFTAMMLGVSDNYLIPYGIALGATPSQIAFLASLPMLVATLLQVHSARVTQTIGSRTKLINVMVFFHALAWLPIILIPYLFRGEAAAPLAPWALLLAAILFASFGAFSVPAWQSLMSDYIPVKKRGQYFGWRNRLQGILMVTVSIIAGLVLHHFGKTDILGFTLIFGFAMMCRFYAWACLTRMAEPFRHASHDVYFSFLDFLKQIRTSNFAKFVLYISLMSFAVNLSAALLPVFLLKDLEVSYASYMVIVTAASVAAFLSQSLWGKYGDLEGNLKTLKIATWGIAVIPVFWMFSHDIAYLFFVQLFAGACWGGFGLLVLNFIMEAVSPEKRIRCISYFNVMNSVATLLGAVAGGLLIGHLPPLFGYPYLSLFLLSGIARVLVVCFVARKVREVRSLGVPAK